MKQTACQNISPYLLDGTPLITEPRADPLNAPVAMVYGNGIHSGGHLLLSEADRGKLLAENRDNERFIHPCIGGNEILNGFKRWVLWLYGSNGEWRKSAFIQNRVERCRQYRLSSSRVRDFADKPWEFGELRQPESGMILAMPKVSSDRRDYLPIVFVGYDVVVNASAMMVPNAEAMHFGILSSAMHSAWLSAAGGRYNTSWQYGCRNVYNTFPWPPLTPESSRMFAGFGQQLLQARKQDGRCLAKQYDPDRMPEALRDVHSRIDSFIERLYCPNGFRTDADRLSCLLRMYAEQTRTESLTGINQWC